MRAGNVDGIESWIEFGESWGSTLQAAASVARTHLEVVEQLKAQRKPGQNQPAGRINLSRI